MRRCPRRYLPIAVAASLLLTLSGCTNDVEATMRGMIGKMNQVTGTLQTVTDPASAAAAAPKVQALATDLQAMSAKLDKLTAVASADKGDAKEAADKLGPQLIDASRSMKREALRAQQYSPELKAALGGLTE